MSSRDDLNLVATLQNLHARLSVLECGSNVGSPANGLGMKNPFGSSKKKVMTVYYDETTKHFELHYGGNTYDCDNKALLVGEISKLYGYG